ncbi:MAG: glutathione synthase [Candidatus Omnitrophica bacterium]|nr:glutathione synthase [Candidatus Omnitrophota bacterium]
MLKIVFVLDPIEKLDWKEDTSCAIMTAACARGHEVFALEMGGAYVRNSVLSARLRKLNVTSSQGISVTDDIPDFNLSDADVIFIRKEPPFDSEYLYLTQLLGLISGKTFILNSPAGLRETNEKLSILEFPMFIAPTLVTANASFIARFAKELNGKIIVKPLDQKGGQGIRRFEPREAALEKTLARLTQNGCKTVMAQQYLSAVQQLGDVRVLLLGGKILGAFSRIPPEGKFIANMDQGGRAVRHKLSRSEEEISRVVGETLLIKGHHFVGIDIIGERLTEINVTSPAGTYEIDQLEGTNTAQQVADYLERQARASDRIPS